MAGISISSLEETTVISDSDILLVKQGTEDKKYQAGGIFGGKAGLRSLAAFTETLLNEAGIVDNGLPDTVGNSQRINALVKLSGRVVNSIKDLGSIPKEADKNSVSVMGFYANTQIGGGTFYWDASRDKTDHNGTTIIAPEAVVAWDGTQEGLDTLLNWSSAGNGCYVSITTAQDVEQNTNIIALGGLVPIYLTAEQVVTANMTNKFVAIGESTADKLYVRTGLTRPDMKGVGVQGEIFYNANGDLYVEERLMNLPRINNPDSIFKTSFSDMTIARVAPTNPPEYTGQQILNVTNGAIYTGYNMTTAGWKTL